PGQTQHGEADGAGREGRTPGPRPGRPRRRPGGGPPARQGPRRGGPRLAARQRPRPGHIGSALPSAPGTDGRLPARSGPAMALPPRPGIPGPTVPFAAPENRRGPRSGPSRARRKGAATRSGGRPLRRHCAPYAVPGRTDVRSLALGGFLELRARGDLHAVAGRDLDRLAGLRVARGARGTVGALEGQETGNGDLLVALGDDVADDVGERGQHGVGVLASHLGAVGQRGHQLTAVHVVTPVFFLLLRRATRRDRVVRTAKPMLPGPRESPGTRVPRPDPRATGGAPWTSSLVKHPASTCGGNANPAPACAV